VDKAEFLVEGAMENHVKMIKSLRGVPGVQMERFQEAHTIKHCALSLVGTSLSCDLC
jgi:tRNA wybutosine-synthesizing protein 1